ncbi:bifunctional diaminohydroxyphosphoribosylaminopyrimidine deaminase/5-amino-6-(5-phosphoribosylamino)uracil reductase RibD [Parahaliea sp. F7430]|uniref:Riboflavin biosynthesis protein RibD n=1 Tax=Sediminihaliea albiluteola TaxID=2758564 RepID=A0A7W2YI18_9GAMM|nr:bifunctional diaminohydroxyphosphoribosylaminopyrimidine deaminase/5-amino-6-(5-phosphoribosylamino)uracil reductase RibD [Sediminihaliea albiluteola]MBA6411560.1 bifunctional diaminohydroxyphosphoribosylaminopyrimidine deaminase/5-amino-6-(5-phosphoribosylamino)uracil reductase RibD [Sediminihaliea albiluteola]
MSNFTETDTRMMARALQVARLGRYSAMPNPHVGCVLLRDGQVIAEGFTQAAGGNHAEIQALQAAGDARGATAYVTLEPCSHYGKTGPCAEALIAAGVVRVVAAMEDPNPQVTGQGLARLRAAGIEVSSGLLQDEAEQLIAGFIARMRRGRGRVRAKLAMSLDGRSAMASGESQWITGPAARQDVQRLRASSCAIITGVGTVLADDCSLTVRAAELALPADMAEQACARQPLRVVMDSRLQSPRTAKVLDSTAPSLLCHAESTEVPAALLDCDRLPLPRTDNGLDLQPLMAELNRRQCNEILVESGPRLAGAMLQAGLLDELLVYMAPTLMGSLAQPLLHLPLNEMSEKVPLQIRDLRQIGQDLRFTLIPG